MHDCSEVARPHFDGNGLFLLNNSLEKQIMQQIPQNFRYLGYVVGGTRFSVPKDRALAMANFMLPTSNKDFRVHILLPVICQKLF